MHSVRSYVTNLKARNIAVVEFLYKNKEATGADGSFIPKVILFGCWGPTFFFEQQAKQYGPRDIRVQPNVQARTHHNGVSLDAGFPGS